MRDLSPDSELVFNSLFVIFFGMFSLTWVYDLFVEHKTANVFFGGLFILLFFTLFPLANAIHWYNEIKDQGRTKPPMWEKIYTEDQFQ